MKINSFCKDIGRGQGSTKIWFKRVYSKKDTSEIGLTFYPLLRKMSNRRLVNACIGMLYGF